MNRLKPGESVVVTRWEGVYYPTDESAPPQTDHPGATMHLEVVEGGARPTFRLVQQWEHTPSHVLVDDFQRDHRCTPKDREDAYRRGFEHGARGALRVLDERGREAAGNFHDAAVHLRGDQRVHRRFGEDVELAAREMERCDAEPAP